ncbi:MAG TPA: glycosyltransferase [Saprospiraceae bacterium]|nr:glycosyltransferase [Saprospiraceae bacterium]
MRIVFVTSRFPYPVEKGDKLRAFHQIRILSQHHEVHLVAISHQRIEPDHLQAMHPFCTTVKVFYVNHWLWPLQLVTGWLAGLPLQISYFLDRTIKRKVQYHIIHLNPDHVICQLIRASPYVRALPFPKTLDYMDVFSEGMKQWADKYGVLGFPFRWEAQRLAAYERSIYKDFDKHTIISQQDRARLKLVSAEQVAIIPNGVDESFFHFPKKPDPAYDLVFVGNLGYGPNKEAALTLAHQVLPALHQRGLKAKVLIAGARPGSKISRLKKLPDVTVKGWVEDIREAYADGRIFVAPMFSGLGLQNKILEAMAMGLPCITTPMVNNAIGAEPGKEIIIARTVEDIVDEIERLMRAPERAAQMAQAAERFVTSHFRWEDQVGKLEKFIKTPYVFATR